MGDAADDMFDRAMLEEFEEYIDEDGEAAMTDNDNKDPQITADAAVAIAYTNDIKKLMAKNKQQAAELSQLQEKLELRDHWRNVYDGNYP